MKRLISLFLAALALLTPAGAQAAGGRVQGTVTPVLAAQEAEVCVVERQPSETCTVPKADGSYDLLDVPFGGAKIEFIPSYRSRLLRQYYQGVSKVEEAQSIVLSPERSVAVGINATLVEGGSIAGIVAAASGGPLPEVEVCAVSVGTPVVKSCGETDPTGAYELHSLSDGTYRVGFRGIGVSAIYEPWSHAPVAVTVGHQTAGVDAALAVGAQVRGRVTAAADGEAIAGTSVCLFSGAGLEPQRCTYSDPAGKYAFVGLPGSTYQVGFSLIAAEIGGESLQGEDDGFESQYYAGAAQRAAATAISVLAPMVVEGVDATLLTPPASSSAPPIAAPSPIVIPPPVAEPPPKAPACKRPKRKKKVGGKVRCVKPAKKTHNHRHHRKKK